MHVRNSLRLQPVKINLQPVKIKGFDDHPCLLIALLLTCSCTANALLPAFQGRPSNCTTNKQKHSMQSEVEHLVT
jgi:hypothetical protein